MEVKARTKEASVPFSGDTNTVNGLNGVLALSLNLRNFMTFLIRLNKDGESGSVQQKDTVFCALLYGA